MSPSPFEWIQQWYSEQCNGVWEHHAGLTITTLDNPGWMLTVDVRGTALELKALEKDRVLCERSAEERAALPDGHWLDCSIKNGKFVGAGGPLDLAAVIEQFREWANGP